MGRGIMHRIWLSIWILCGTVSAIWGFGHTAKTGEYQAGVLGVGGAMVSVLAYRFGMWIAKGTK